MNNTMIELAEKEYRERKIAFDLWKNTNAHLLGTPDYEKYTKRFADYENDYLDKMQRLRNPTVEGPRSVDSILMELLENISFRDFFAALKRTDELDKDFVSAMIKNLNTVQATGLVVPVAVNPANYHVGSASSYYSMPTMPTMPSVTSWGQSPHWNSNQHLRKFKPPSPHRDYKNPASSMPFKDFSQ
ncbi:unnamed protein product [Auanema sp. JU1783]|nr:unnamed protein product [Auanema sp. JU1783]